VSNIEINKIKSSFPIYIVGICICVSAAFAGDKQRGEELCDTLRLAKWHLLRANARLAG
jgi:hypothetical protein